VAGLAVCIYIFEYIDGNKHFRHRSFSHGVYDALFISIHTLSPAGPPSEVEITSRITRALLAINTIVSIFVLFILAAIITSQLTIESLTTANIPITSPRIRGSNILAHSRQLYVDTLTQNRFNVVQADNFIDSAATFFESDASTFLAGISSVAPVVDYLVATYAKIWQPAFTAHYNLNNTGTKLTIAIPVARDLPQLRAFNVALQTLKDGGYLDQLASIYFQGSDFEAGLDQDIPIEDASFYGVIGSVGLFYGLIGLLALRDAFAWVRGKKEASDDMGQQQRKSDMTLHTQESMKEILV
ncbi:hypothetical protein BC830DRAFT_58511, partial [Chytriomyces sp. MP71]